MKEAWIIDYDNDTGPNDEGFTEWWIVRDCFDNHSFKCSTYDDANWLCTILNRFIPL